jgi:hypothetical protein
MQRTAAHVLSSPNPTQLEMRILANHGNDPRFAFLRGRWKRVWEATRLANAPKKPEVPVKAGGSGLGALAGYGDSGDESDGSA